MQEGRGYTKWPRLGEDAALLDRAGDAFDGDDEGSLARRAVVRLRLREHEITTPPAFARMSGMIVTPRSARARSASAVIGPFAPSTMIGARTSCALLEVICASSAAGTRTSTSIATSSALLIFDTPPRPSRRRWGWRCTCSIARATSMPCGAA